MGPMSIGGTPSCGSLDDKPAAVTALRRGMVPNRSSGTRESSAVVQWLADTAGRADGTNSMLTMLTAVYT